MSFYEKLRRIARREKANPTDDAASVTAALNIAARLVAEGWTQFKCSDRKGDNHFYDIYGALAQGVEMSAAQDQIRTWWAAHSALVKNLPPQFLGDLVVYNDTPGRTQAEVVEFIKQAARNHAAVAVAQAKGPRP